MSTDTDDQLARQPKQWGVVAGTFWVVAAFLLPQFALSPFAQFFLALPVSSNVKQFLAQGILELAAVGLLWAILRYVYNSDLRAIGLGKIVPNKLAQVVWAFPLYLLISSLVTSAAGVLFKINLEQSQQIGYSINPGGMGWVLVFVGLVVLAPFAEELLFRGFLFNAFRRTFGFWAGSIVVSLLFALAHGQWNVGIDVFVLSMFLCYLREKTHSLWPSILMHASKNLLAFVVLFIMGFN